MNSLADTLLIGSPTPERREQAEAWLNKALDIIEDAKTSSKGDAKAIGHCELVLAAALFNLGSLREVGLIHPVDYRKFIEMCRWLETWERHGKPSYKADSSRRLSSYVKVYWKPILRFVGLIV